MMAQLLQRLSQHRDCQVSMPQLLPQLPGCTVSRMLTTCQLLPQLPDCIVSRMLTMSRVGKQLHSCRMPRMKPQPLRQLHEFTFSMLTQPWTLRQQGRRACMSQLLSQCPGHRVGRRLHVMQLPALPAPQAKCSSMSHATSPSVTRWGLHPACYAMLCPATHHQRLFHRNGLWPVC